MAPDVVAYKGKAGGTFPSLRLRSLPPRPHLMPHLDCRRPGLACIGGLLDDAAFDRDAIAMVFDAGSELTGGFKLGPREFFQGRQPAVSASIPPTTRSRIEGGRLQWRLHQVNQRGVA